MLELHIASLPNTCASKTKHLQTKDQQETGVIIGHGTNTCSPKTYQYHVCRKPLVLSIGLGEKADAESAAGGVSPAGQPLRTDHWNITGPNTSPPEKERQEVLGVRRSNSVGLGGQERWSLGEPVERGLVIGHAPDPF